MLYVVLGATQFTQPGPGAVVRNVKQVVTHPYYKRVDFRYDIALLQLDHSVQCSPYIQLACVAYPNLRISEFNNCWIAGWGVTTRPKPGCRMYPCAEMGLTCSPKAGNRDTVPQCLCRGKAPPKGEEFPSDRGGELTWCCRGLIPFSAHS
uniref:Peptidase S1 domain-containing protein n=1 Tax=Zosterops lateralis melanops TaxID=1220523 RepID=A0A8D2PXB6_ZOSLA